MANAYFLYLFITFPNNLTNGEKYDILGKKRRKGKWNFGCFGIFSRWRGSRTSRGRQRRCTSRSPLYPNSSWISKRNWGRSCSSAAKRKVTLTEGGGISAAAGAGDRGACGQDGRGVPENGRGDFRGHLDRLRGDGGYAHSRADDEKTARAFSRRPLPPVQRERCGRRRPYDFPVQYIADGKKVNPFRFFCGFYSFLQLSCRFCPGRRRAKNAHKNAHKKTRKIVLSV